MSAGATTGRASELVTEHLMALETLSYALLGARLAGDTADAITRRALIAAQTATPGAALDWAVELHDMLATRLRTGDTLWAAVRSVRTSPRGAELYHQIDAIRRAQLGQEGQEAGGEQ